MWQAVIALALFCVPASMAETLRLPLTHEPARVVSGVTEFVVGLPRHITVQAESQLTLVLHLRAAPGPAPEPIRVNVNGQDLQPRFAADAPSFALRVEADVPASALQAGWNRISAYLPQQVGTCEVRKAESHLTLDFQRVPLFVELRRFPESLTEEKLLKPEAGQPTVAVLLPERRRDVHLRACAIIGARLGQQNYFKEADYELLEIANWPSVENRNAVVVGRADELGTLPFLTDMRDRLAGLGSGRGMLAEFILGDFPNQRRWILATGADDAGLEKAILTLGSRPALDSLTPSPTEIVATPEVTLQMELLARPNRSQVTFKDLGWREIEVGRWPEHRFGWRLPPGYELEGGQVTVNFLHPPNVLKGALAASLGEKRLGEVELNATNAEAGSVTFDLPRQYAGLDPAMFTFTATTTNEQHRGRIATVLGNSMLEVDVKPARIRGLEDLNALLLRDAFLRRMAVVLLNPPTLNEMKAMTDVAMRLGRQTPSSPILWPEACLFGEGSALPVERLKARSVVVIAPVGAWGEAAPEARLSIEQTGPNTVRMQGRKSRISEFEKHLTLMQMAPAPWSEEDWLVMVGGWTGVDLEAARRMITSAAAEGMIYGNMAAFNGGDSRFAAHDSRKPAIEYFAQILKKRVPAGLTAEQTREHLKRLDARRERSLWLNRFLMWSAGILMGVIILGRVALVWERSRDYRKMTKIPMANTK